MKSILDLCRDLPASEPETRERAREFGAVLGEKVLGWQWRVSASTGRRCLYPLGRHPAHMRELADGAEDLVTDWDGMPLPDPFSIADAKTATDAMIARGCLIFTVGIDPTLHKCEITFHDLDTQVKWEVGAYATTEELARSAAALLAAEVMKGER